MSDILRTALKGGGKIDISIDVWANGDFHLWVVEKWASLTSVEQSVIPAERLTAAADPDALIGAELSRLTQAAHISWEAHKKEPPAPGADNTAQVAR